MDQPGGDPDLADETIGADGSRDFRCEELEGDRTVELPVVSEDHHRHPAAPQFTRHLKPFGELPRQVRLLSGVHYWSLREGPTHVAQRNKARVFYPPP